MSEVPATDIPLSLAGAIDTTHTRTLNEAFHRGGHELDALSGPSRARGLSGSVRGFIGLDALEGAPLIKNRLGDTGELVGEGNRQHVVV